MPITVFLPASEFSLDAAHLLRAKVVKPVTDLDPIGVGAMMNKLLFVTGPLVGTKAVKKMMPISCYGIATRSPANLYHVVLDMQTCI
jgi:aldehyde:ferredoxin oxidoreductase